MTEFTFLMARHGGLNKCETAAILRLQSIDQGVQSYNAAFLRFIEAVSEWVKTTETGREAWEASVGDINIGDMLTYDHFQEPELKACLLRRGVEVVQAHQLVFDQQRDFDEVLASGDVVCNDCNEHTSIYDCISSRGGVWHCGCKEVQP